MNELKLGTAKVDITPEHPLRLAGFGHRQGPFESVARPLYARLLLFEQEGETGPRRALLVSADLIWWDADSTARLRHQLKTLWRLEEGAVVLHATHTHSGPQTSTGFVFSLGVPDPAYLRGLEATVLDVVERAYESLEPVTVERGGTELRIGINRRGQIDGEIGMIPNPDGPIDPEVVVVRFCGRDKGTKAMLVHYACHPTTTDDNRVSSDFPGVAMELLEAELEDEAVAAYLQGCCGDIRPWLTEDGRFYRGGDAEVRRLGEELASRVSGVLESPMTELAPGSLRGRRTKISLPLQELPELSELEAACDRADVVGDWAGILLDDPQRVQQSIALELAVLDLAQGLSLLSLGAELVVEYGLFLKERFAGEVLPLPYSSGMLGYVPTARQVGEGGYEADESTLYFVLPAPFAPEVESRVRNGMVGLVEEGNG